MSIFGASLTYFEAHPHKIYILSKPKVCPNTNSNTIYTLQNNFVRHTFLRKYVTRSNVSDLTLPQTLKQPHNYKISTDKNQLVPLKKINIHTIPQARKKTLWIICCTNTYISSKNLHAYLNLTYQRVLIQVSEQVQYLNFHSFENRASRTILQSNPIA